MICGYRLTKLAIWEIAFFSHLLPLYLNKDHMSWLQTKAIGWQESKRVNREDKYESSYTIAFSGMHISFEICCVNLNDQWMTE
jgi:hypothetical protein